VARRLGRCEIVRHRRHDSALLCGASTSPLGDLQVIAGPIAILLFGSWGLILTLLVVCTAFLQLSFRRLRQSHADIWRNLGEPHVLGDRRTYYSARKFVWSKQCRELDDAVLTRRASFSYYSGMSAAVLGLALVAVLAIQAVLHALQVT